MRLNSCAATLFVTAVVLFGCSCSPSENPAAQKALKVTDIDLGRSLAADKTISDKTDTFTPTEIIYVSVRTDGTASNAALTARWTYEGGQPVDESNQTISPNGPAVTEFHVSKPDGWPAGNYKVEILLNGVPAGTKDFKVQ
jgi:hypothetical protein